MIFAFLINVIAVLANVIIGMAYGFTDITWLCIGANSAVGLFCLFMGLADY